MSRNIPGDAVDDDDEKLSAAGFEDGDALVNEHEYAARMIEIMDSDHSDDDDDGFVYDGVDAPKLDYKDQLRDALSDDDEDVENAKDERTVEQIIGVTGCREWPQRR